MDPSLLESVFASVRKSPKSIPLLVYLHPPLAGQPTGVLANEVIDLLVAYYPEDLREDVFEALAMDPGRIIPMIPLILENITAPERASEPQPPQIVPSPSTPTSPPSACSRFSDDDPFLERGSPRPLPDFICGPPPPPLPFRRAAIPRQGARASTPPLQPLNPPSQPKQHTATPRRLFEGPKADLSSVVGDAFVRIDTRPRSFTTSLQTEIQDIRDATIFRTDRNMYHLSVPKPFLLNMACGFLLGAFSFLALRTLSYSPLGALVGSLPLSVALLLVVCGLPIPPEENR